MEDYWMKSKEVYPAEKRPVDGQSVIYYFEPFSKWYIGTYEEETDSVFGKWGFTTWYPEVLFWMTVDEYLVVGEQQEVESE